MTLSATGLGAAGVAAAMGWTPEAVRNLLISSRAKLGARSKLEAVVIAIKRGLIDPSP